MNPGARPGIVNGVQQQNMLAMNQNFMQTPAPPMSLLNQAGAPGQQRFAAMPPQAHQQLQQQQLQQQQQRQLAMGRPQQQPHLPFNPANMMTQTPNSVTRRVPSQPHMHLGLPGQMGMRPGQSLQQHQQQQRLQQMNPIDMARQQAQQQAMARTASNGQVMNSLNAPHMQPAHQQANPFQATQPHMTPQIAAASPRQPPSLGMSGIPAAGLPLNRARMNPEDSFMFPGSQFPGGGTNMPRQGMNNTPNGMYPFGSTSTTSNPASSPPPGMQISDLAQGSPASIGHSASGPSNRNSLGGFMSSSPQQFDVMSNGPSDSLFNSMPPPAGMPPRPPSHGATPLSQQHLQAQQQQHMQQMQRGPQLSMSMAMDPMNSIMNSASLNAMGMGQMQPQRPQSQPQNVMGMGLGMPGRPPSQASNNTMGNAVNGASIPRPSSARQSPNHMQMSSNNAPSSSNGIPNNNGNPSNPSTSVSPQGPSNTLSTSSNSGSISNSTSTSSNAIPPGIPLTATGRIPNAPTGTSMPQSSGPSGSGGYTAGGMSSMMPIAPRPPSAMRGGGPPSTMGANNPLSQGSMGANPPGFGPQGPSDQERQSLPPGGGGNAAAMAGSLHGSLGAHSGGIPVPGRNMALGAGTAGGGPGPGIGGHPPFSNQNAQVKRPQQSHEGKSLVRLLQFSGRIASIEDWENKKKLSYQWWKELVEEFFHEDAHLVLGFISASGSGTNAFDLDMHNIARFFFASAQGGVKSMSLGIDGVQEIMLSATFSHILSPQAQWIWHYTNGYFVVMKGAITVHARTEGSSLKFSQFIFNAKEHTKFLDVSYISGFRSLQPQKEVNSLPRARVEGHSPTNTPPSEPVLPEKQVLKETVEDNNSIVPALIKIEDCEIPGEPVTEFGISRPTQLILEIAETVSSMSDLFGYVAELKSKPEHRDITAKQALARWSHNLVETKVVIMPPSYPPMFIDCREDAYPNAPYEGPLDENGRPIYIGYILFPDGTSMFIKDEKEVKRFDELRLQTAPVGIAPDTLPPPTPSVAESPAVSSGGTTNNTPALASASLKRKTPGSAEATSPATASQEPAASGPKPRAPRKRNRTQPS